MQFTINGLHTLLIGYPHAPHAGADSIPPSPYFIGQCVADSTSESAQRECRLDTAAICDLQCVHNAMYLMRLCGLRRRRFAENGDSPVRPPLFDADHELHVASVVNQID